MIKLKFYKGKAFRAETNLLIKGKTALDVIEFEEKEQGKR
jgi:hypothetical protein